MVRRAHMAEPHEPTWTHVDAYVAQGGFGLAHETIEMMGPWVSAAKTRGIACHIGSNRASQDALIW